MVRLVFRPYTQLRRSICTSESLRSSTRVSPGFDLVKHRSPSFGSQRVRSRFVRPLISEASDAQRVRPLCSRRDLLSVHLHQGTFTFIAPHEFRFDSTTRAHVRLLGPCFKTGRVRSDYYFSASSVAGARARPGPAMTGHGRVRVGKKTPR